MPQIKMQPHFNIYLPFYIFLRLLEDHGLNQTGMAILEVGLLTGFSLAQSGVPINSLVRRVETSPGKVVLYLDSVSILLQSVTKEMNALVFHGKTFPDNSAGQQCWNSILEFKLKLNFVVSVIFSTGQKSQAPVQTIYLSSD